MNYCIYIRKRKNKPYCKLKKEEILLIECNNCFYKEYKNNYPHKSGNMKNKSNKLAKLERKRFSIIIEDLSVCCVSNCNCNIGINKHEIFYGSYRHTSIKYGLVIPLCPFHHTIGKNAIHNNRKMDLYYKRLGQTIFEEKYSHELFIKEFKIDYLKKYK